MTLADKNPDHLSTTAMGPESVVAMITFGSLFGLLAVLFVEQKSRPAQTRRKRYKVSTIPFKTHLVSTEQALGASDYEATIMTEPALSPHSEILDAAHAVSNQVVEPSEAVQPTPSPVMGVPQIMHQAQAADETSPPTLAQDYGVPDTLQSATGPHEIDETVQPTPAPIPRTSESGQLTSIPAQAIYETVQPTPPPAQYAKLSTALSEAPSPQSFGAPSPRRRTGRTYRRRPAPVLNGARQSTSLRHRAKKR